MKRGKQNVWVNHLLKLQKVVRTKLYWQKKNSTFSYLSPKRWPHLIDTRRWHPLLVHGSKQMEQVDSYYRSHILPETKIVSVPVFRYSKSNGHAHCHISKLLCTSVSTFLGLGSGTEDIPVPALARTTTFDWLMKSGSCSSGS